VGRQMAVLPSSSTGTPSERTRVAAVTHPAPTHGPPATAGKGQPEMTYGDDRVAIGRPPTRTRELAVTGCAWPPCTQRASAPSRRTNPGITSRPKRRRDEGFGTAEVCPGTLPLGRPADLRHQLVGPHVAGWALRSQDAALISLP
jgi:hypothetical protein